MDPDINGTEGGGGGRSTSYHSGPEGEFWFNLIRG